MRIMVFDVAAELGGALSILQEYYAKAIEHPDKTFKWIFILSKPEFEETDNIKILRFPWIKKSWMHRLFFDYYVAPKLVKKYEVDQVLSLQNLVVPRIKKVRQSVYVHQSLPFVEYKIKPNESFKLWIYQNLIGKKIKDSIRKADEVIVQANWMKEVCLNKVKVDSKKIKVEKPKVSVPVKGFFKSTKMSRRTFFYPAGAGYYKNHRIIVKACEKLIKEGRRDFKVIFTVNGNENKHISELYFKSKQKKLPIDYIGEITREEVFDFYIKSILIFPSYIETFGLPMLEARLHNSIILASDCLFSHEILDNYSNAYFFNSFDYRELANLMKSVMKGELTF